MGKVKKGQEEGVSKFDGFGVDFKCKLIGLADVTAARGDDVCQNAINTLKAQALKNNKEKKEHKQRITVNITLKGIRLLDEKTERIDHAHPIHRISFISHDNDDKRTFGYIVGTKEGYKLFAIKSMKEAEQITKTLKELFQEVFERYQDKKKDDSAEQPEEKGEEQVQENINEDKQNEESTYAVPSDPFSDWNQLNDQIQVMQSDSIPNSNSFDLLSDLAVPSTTSDPFQSDLYATVDKKQKAPQVDFFSETSTKPPLNSTTQTSQGEAGDEALLMNDPFAELKKNINELHDQNDMQRQQRMFMGGYHVTQPTNQLTQQSNQHNPFASNRFGTNQPYVSNQNGFPPQQQRVQAGYHQHSTVPHGGMNPFMQTAAPPPTPQDDMGWTLDKPILPTNVTKSPPMAAFNTQADPFAFLDHQTASNGNVTGSTTTQQNVGGNSTNASDELLDFLG